MDYIPKVGDWILFSTDFGLKIGIVRYVKEQRPSHRLVDGPIAGRTVYYTDTDQVLTSEILEIRT